MRCCDIIFSHTLLLFAGPSQYGVYYSADMDSRVGLTSNCYVFSLRFELLMLRFLFKKLKVLFAFLQMLAMCSLHFISDVTHTPRYLTD